MRKTKSIAQRSKQLKALKYRAVTETDTRDIPEVRDWIVLVALNDFVRALSIPGGRGVDGG